MKQYINVQYSLRPLLSYKLGCLSTKSFNFYLNMARHLDALGDRTPDVGMWQVLSFCITTNVLICAYICVLING